MKNIETLSKMCIVFLDIFPIIKTKNNNFKSGFRGYVPTIIHFIKVIRRRKGKRGNMGYGEAVFGTMEYRFPLWKPLQERYRIGRNGIALFLGIPMKSVEGG